MITDKLLKHLNEITLSDEDKVEEVRTAAAGVVYKEGENGERMVLLIQRAREDHWPLHWEFPRSKCDKKGESPEQCALREIKEESGLDVEVEGFLGKFEYLAMGGKRRTICYNYQCRMKNPNQKVVLKPNAETGDLEHESYKWITQVGEAELLVFPDQKKMIEQVLSTDNPIANTPKNSFTKNNSLEEFLKRIQ
jgi:8-oxo-dGTP pyrophosphatase MutT (NUDIX family)